MATDTNFLFNLNTFTTSASITSSLVSTINSCSSNASSNSSSFIQLTNDTDLDHHQQQKSPSPIESNKYKFILNAYVNGFVQLKLCADKIDYEYIIEIYWSNNTKTFIKRTYEDFILFHRKIIKVFCLSTNTNLQNNTNNTNTNKLKQLILNSNFIDRNSNSEKEIPTLSGKKPFWMSHLKLAELREAELNLYVQRLLKLPIQISHSSLILEFFETQSSDPKPFNHVNYYDDNSTTTLITNTNIDEYQNDNGNYDDYEVNYDLKRQNSSNYDDDDTNHIHSNNNNNSNNGTNDDSDGALWWDEDNALNELTSCSINNNDSLLNIDFLYANADEQFESLEQILNKNFNEFHPKIEEN